MERQFDWFTLS